MDNRFSFLADAFQWISATEVLGLPLLSWIVIALVLSIAGFIVRGNHS